MNNVIIELPPSSLVPTEYRFLIPKKDRYLFPNHYSKISLHTDEGDVMERHYNPKYNQISVGEWFSIHHELKPHDKIIVTVIEPMKKYRLEIVK